MLAQLYACPRAYTANQRVGFRPGLLEDSKKKKKNYLAA